MIKNKTKRTTITTLIIIGFLITATPFFLPKTQAANDDSFSIMQISDTQFLSVSFPQLFKDTTSWIVNNSATYNLKMVIHTGDIVDNINSTSGAYSDPVQWNTANIAMSSLLNAGIPYCWDAGNHDQIPWNDASGTWLGSSYAAFNASNMRSNNYWVSDTADSKNTAVKFSYNGYEFLIINVEYKASNATLTWMRSLLDNNKGANVIVAAHTYLNVKGGYGFASAGLPGEVAWCTSFKAILDSYPNVFLTLSGHDPTGTANMTRVGNREEIFFNRQAATTTAGQTGCAAVRIYTFNLTSKNVSTTTYSLDTQTWLTNAYNQFSFNANLKLPLTAAATQSASVISAFGNVNFTASPSGGVAPYSYQWYQDSAAIGGVIVPQINVGWTIASTHTYFCSITDAAGAITNTSLLTLTITATPTPIPTSVSPTNHVNPTSTPATVPTNPPNPTDTPTPTPVTTIPPSVTASPIAEESAFSTTAIYAVLIIAAIVIILSIVLVIRKRKIKL
jgi:hypothetical protein